MTPFACAAMCVLRWIATAIPTLVMEVYRKCNEGVSKTLQISYFLYAAWSSNGKYIDQGSAQTQNYVNEYDHKDIKEILFPSEDCVKQSVTSTFRQLHLLTIR